MEQSTKNTNPSADGWLGLLKRTAAGWIYHDAPRIGAALAFYTLLSFAPLLMLSLVIGSLVFDHTQVESHVLQQIGGLAGTESSDLARAMIDRGRQPGTGVAASLVGIVTLVLGASGILGEVRAALNTIWDIPTKGSAGISGIVRDRLLSMGMVLAIGFLLVVSLVMSAVLAATGGYLGHLLPVPASVLEVANFLISLVGNAVVFALVLRYIPDVRLPWRYISYGAVGTAVLFTIGKTLIGFYLGRAGLGSLYGAGGSVVVLVVWVYYSAQIFLFGAEFTRQLSPKASVMPSQRETNGDAI